MNRSAANAAAKLYDPRRGDHALRLEKLRVDAEPFNPVRSNYFAIYFIESGRGVVWADASRFAFGPAALLFFVPYQHVRFVPETRLCGEVIEFHANFLCVETFHAEVGCSGILFNDPYGVPIVPLDQDAKRGVANLIERIRQEQQAGALAFGEVMLAYLKVLLIVATRLKSPTGAACDRAANELRHPVLAQFRDLIEEQYLTLHTPADYARQLHVTPKTLGRIVRDHLGTTPTALIRNRILTHAKWQLLHTLRPVKEIARALKFGDELYFSRLFKKATGYSPTFFREFETQIRGGSNLSMLSAHAPMEPMRRT